MIAVIIVVVIALVVIVGAIIASSGGSGADLRELDRRKWEAQRQVRDIGQRTREAIRAEALRRKQRGE